VRLFVLEEGAEVVAVLVAEQPEVVLAEDRLPTVTGINVVHRARILSPFSFIALQVADEDALQQALDAGARAAYTRQVPPADIAHDIQIRLASGAATTAPRRCAVSSRAASLHTGD